MRIGQVKPPPAWLSVRERRLASASKHPEDPTDKVKRTAVRSIKSEQQKARMRIRQVKPPPAWLSVRERRLARVSTKKIQQIKNSSE
jgi:hypothetical protein